MLQPGLEGLLCLSWTHSEWGTLNMVWLLLWGCKGLQCGYRQTGLMEGSNGSADIAIDINSYYS